jgi:hypothetical protein
MEIKVKTFQKPMALSLITATIVTASTPEQDSAASNKRSSDDAGFARLENELSKCALIKKANRQSSAHN